MSKLSPFGINAHIPSLKMLNEVQECGIGWVRVDFLRQKIEKETSVYDWRVYDRIAHEAAARKIAILGCISGPPTMPTIDETWEAFCFAAASRYRPGNYVEAWSIWNEPNLERFWTHDFEWYSRMWALGAHAIKRGNSRAKLVGPDLAHLTGAKWDLWLIEFLDRHGEMIEALAHHCYPSDDTAANLRMKLERGEKWPWCPPPLRDVLDYCGWDGPVWITETGVRALDDDDGATRQAQFYHDLLREAFWPDESWFGWLHKIFFYHLHDDPRHNDGFGICGPPPDLVRRPSWFALNESIGALREVYKRLGEQP
jgi:hypothetical protein